MKKLEAAKLDSSFFRSMGTEVPQIVPRIIDDVRNKGDEALRKYTRKFDGCEVETFRVPSEEIEVAHLRLSGDLHSHLARAAGHIENFARKQLEAFKDIEWELEQGVLAGQKIIPIERIGLYVPGGRYPLSSSVLMGAIPARVAGVNELALFSPPSKNGKISPQILVAAGIANIDEVYTIGGAQAIAAMAYGTQSVKPVCKIVGPGNVYVNAAKKLVYGVVGVDFIAGPTEILIIADESANPCFVAADLIAQAEHDVEARSVLLTDSANLAADVEKEVKEQLQSLETGGIAGRALQKNGIIILFDGREEAVEIANLKAPEHLQLCVENPEYFIQRLVNYGSLFVGEFTPETLGDYSSGLNHVLPTNAASRYTGGLSVRDFVKVQTFLKVEQKGFNRIGPVAASLARAEGLSGHAEAIRVRLEHLKA